MALDMSRATNAVSNKGVQEMITTLQTQIKGVYEAMLGPEYNTFLNVVDQNWSGASRDTFVRDFKEKVNSARGELKNLTVQVQHDLTNTKDTFIKADASVYQAKR